MTDTNISPTSDAFLYSVNKLAEALGISRDTVKKRVARIPAVKQRNGFDVYHLRDVVTIIEDQLAANPDDMSPKNRKDWYEGELRRVDIAKKKGQLLALEDVRQTWAETLKQIMLTLDTLVDVIERDIGLTTDQIKAIQSVIDMQRENLYQELCNQDTPAQEQLSAS